jgi:hypothetical protein
LLKNLTIANATNEEIIWASQIMTQPFQNPKITPEVISISGTGSGRGGIAVLTTIITMIIRGAKVP